MWDRRASKLTVLRPFTHGEPEILSESELEFSPYKVWCKDADGDGTQDLFLTGTTPNNSLYVMRSRTDGTFDPPVVLTDEPKLLWNPYHLKTADTDNDGKDEIIVFDSRCRTLAVCDLEWQTKKLIVRRRIRASVEAYGRCVERNPFLVDMNEDGFTDLLIVHAGIVVFLKGGPEGLAPRSRTYPVADSCFAWSSLPPGSDRVVLAKYVSPDRSEVGLGRIEGNGGITPPSSYSNVFLNLEVFQDHLPAHLLDCNGDGRSDILSMGMYTLDLVVQREDGAFENVIHFHLGDPSYFPGFIRPPTVSTGDFDGDGAEDVAFISQGTGPDVAFFLEAHRFLPDHDPPFSQIFRVPTAMAAEIARAYDFDGDGFSDIIFQPSYSQLRIAYPNESGIRETRSLNLGLPSDFNSLVSDFAIDDLNDDGFPDIVAAHGGYGLTVFYGSKGGFTKRRRFLQDYGAIWVLTGDVNGDGFKDIVARVRYAQQQFAADHYLATLWGAESDPFSESDFLLINDVADIRRGSLRDLDGDGLPEFITNSFLVFWNHSVEPPQADFSVDRPKGYTPHTVTFTYTGSTESRDLLLTWALGDGSRAEGKSVTHTYEIGGDEPETFTVTLTAENRMGSARATEEVTVYPPLTFDFEGKTAPDDALCLKFESKEASSFLVSSYWLFGDGSFSEEAEPVHCFERSGSYLVTCTVEGPAPGEPGNSLSVSHAFEVGYRFVRGDANRDGEINIADAIHIAEYLFGMAEAKNCLDAFDTNDTGAVDISDVIFLAMYLFQGGKPCPDPFPDPGLDPTPDEIECH